MKVIGRRRTRFGISASDRTSMDSPSLLGKALRRQIRIMVWPILKEEGFVEFGPLRAYRISPGRVEMVEFSPFRREWNEPRWLGGNAFANGACFSLYVATYAGEGAEETRPRYQECHWCTKLHHGDMDSPADGCSFYTGENGEKIEDAIQAAVRALQSRGLAILGDHGRKSPPTEEVGLSSEEAAEMMRICREGRSVRSGAMDELHRRLHLSDEHTVAV